MSIYSTLNVQSAVYPFLFEPHDPSLSVPVFENRDKIILVMEYASGGELYDYINEKHGLYEEEARKFFRQIASAVHYLHMVGVYMYASLLIKRQDLEQNFFPRECATQ